MVGFSHAPDTGNVLFAAVADNKTPAQLPSAELRDQCGFHLNTDHPVPADLMLFSWHPDRDMFAELARSIYTHTK